MIIWDKAKAARLFETREISLAEIADMLLERRYLAILESPSRPEQMVFVLPYGSLREEIDRLLVHGLLHLLGYDHERGGQEARRMEACERSMREALER